MHCIRTFFYSSLVSNGLSNEVSTLEMGGFTTREKTDKVFLKGEKGKYKEE